MNLDALARLLRYPDETYISDAAGCPDFAASIAGLSLAELQELYVQTFEMRPDACLDAGWHLFGENYERGEFLVKMRQEIRRHGLAESTELPDHLTHVLPVLARMEADEAAQFSERYLAPALEKILAAFKDGNNPYERLLRAVAGREQ